jgi:transcriptional regulator with XRE-family HTH domain
MHFSQKIRLEREKLGLSKNAAAQSVGVSAAYWDKIEKGESVPTVDVAARIGKVMGLPAQFFFEGSEIVTPSDVDKALEQKTRHLLGERYNNDSMVIIKRFKFKDKKAVLNLLSEVEEVAKNG